MSATKKSEPRRRSQKHSRVAAPTLGWANTAKLQLRDLRKRLTKMPDPDNRALVNRFYMNELMDKLEANLDLIRAAACSPNAALSHADET